MPELPEVETICGWLRQGRGEQPSLLGKHIQRCEVFWPRAVAMPSIAEFQARVVGQVVQQIGRRGKYLLLCLTEDYLLVHLRMSGDLLVERDELPVAPHHRWILHFTGGWRLAFNDPRKFGRAWLVQDPHQVLADLGPEPLDENLTASKFHLRLQSTHRQLKPLLLDQSFLAGLGNIYTDEALHLARLHPLRRSDSLDQAESQRLLESIRQILAQGIARHGASIDWVYRGGDFQNYFRAYQRTGQPCPACGAPIERLVVGQRGTHICPVCQARPA